MVRDVDSQGNCSKCGGMHFGSYTCPIPTQQEKEMNAVTEMPRYQSHKTVWALKIKEVNLVAQGSHTLIPEDRGYAPIEVSDEYVKKHSPEAGGYYVVYKDGYKSFSPAAAFEEGYTRV